MLVGNDISAAQGSIVWSVYKDNTNFVIPKATEGVGFIDAQYGNNRKEARDYNLLFGSYHFARPDLGNSPEAEGEWFCKVIDGDPIRQGELLFLDFEVGYHDIVNWSKGFLDYVKNHYKGNISPLIYLNQNLTTTLDWQPVVDAGYGLWLASYNPDGQGNTGKWPFMAFQQTSSVQQVPGITGNVDRDVFFGTAEDFTKYGYHEAAAIQPAPISTPVVEPTPQETPVTSVPEATTNDTQIPTVEQPTTPENPPTLDVPPQNAPVVTKLNWLENLIHQFFTWLRNQK